MARLILFYFFLPFLAMCRSRTSTGFAMTLFPPLNGRSQFTDLQFGHIRGRSGRRGYHLCWHRRQVKLGSLISLAIPIILPVGLPIVKRLRLSSVQRKREPRRVEAKHPAPRSLGTIGHKLGKLGLNCAGFGELSNVFSLPL